VEFPALKDSEVYKDFQKVGFDMRGQPVIIVGIADFYYEFSSVNFSLCANSGHCSHYDALINRERISLLVMVVIYQNLSPGITDSSNY